MEGTQFAALYDALRTIAQFMDIHSRSLHKHAGVTGPQLSILLALGQESPMHVSKISKKVHLSIGTLSGTITRLEKNGLIERKQGADDKRKVFFTLTEQGHRIIDNGSSPLPLNFMRQFENGLPEWEKNMILSMLQRVIHLMQDPQGPGCQPTPMAAAIDPAAIIFSDQKKRKPQTGL